ncbi:type IV pilus assembly protein PilY1 [Ectothiorhodospira magna]|uniref:Type IV pilus assembly protein PilY1 n=1 Tax=Ectothiorhodospira magna TaxID=867345 RepID=A0A1H9B852_9GAMM|nr:PilC/PilY family type IV pilus protein [Ectothiorhodospira magna]SEP85134.1 type IV pilus assembly protein PilY1 [Ectothiorhodospira magna]
MLTLKHRRAAFRFTSLFFLAVVFSFGAGAQLSANVNISQIPLLVSQSVQPLVMLNMSNDNQLYFHAYPDYADLTGDGAPNTTYAHEVDYFGYFDAYKCYKYDNGVFDPVALTADKYCTGEQWSGNFLNWLTMARIDVVRKILYGGYRSTDDANETILERSYLPNDAHAWVRYYDGEDIEKLTPFSLPLRTVSESSSVITIPAGDRNSADHRRTFSTSWASNEKVQIGDQIIIRDREDPDNKWMEGVVRSRTGGNVEIQVTASSGSGATGNDWELFNDSRRGVSFCNTTVGTGSSQNINTPPLLRVARGNYSLWTANERWQCRWSGEASRGSHNGLNVAGLQSDNANTYSSSGLFANFRNPIRNDVQLGSGDYHVRLRVCVTELLGAEDCKQYPSGSNKPIGLLQRYGEDGSILFGLMTGSYSRNLSGGTLRKNIKSFADEIDAQTGRFIVPSDGGSIIRSLDALRIYGYNHGTGVYDGAGDSCGVGVQKSQMTDGKCMSWGNPQAEIFLESLRYFAGKPMTSGFHVSGSDKLSNLQSETWVDPLNDHNWCAASSIINFNASVSSFDGDQLGGFSSLPGAGDVSEWTDKVGKGEGLHGQQRFFGGNNALCTAKPIGVLSDVSGLCPEAPNQDGTFHIAGLAHYAYTKSIRTDLRDHEGNAPDTHVKTYGVTLAPAVPRINIPRPGETETAVTILPACENKGDGGLRCALSDFRIVEQDIEKGTGRFFIQWDVHEWGSDFDMDINGTLSYVITENEITVTTNAWAQSSSRPAGFGYIISGTTQDGYHAHSGINDYTYVDPTGVLGCNNCGVGDPETSVTYTLGGDTAKLLREPLFYAAKWGGYHKTGGMTFPDDVASWDRTGDGLPDNYFFAIDPARLAEGLTQAFDAIAQAATATTSAAVSSPHLLDGTLVFVAGFDSTDWSGELKAYALNADGSRGQEAWNAATRLSSNNTRAIFTTQRDSMSNISTKGVILNLSSLHPNQQDAINHNPGGDAGLAEERLGWIRGNDNADQSFRQRPHRLGDIVHSNPQFIRQRYEGFSRILGAPSLRDIKPVIYVASNGGMLHAFDADTGDELFAFMPGELLLPEAGETFSPMSRLMEKDYQENRRFYVDGTVTVEEALINNNWRRILVGTMGAGGRSVFALDVSDPGKFNQDHVLWEFSHEQLGYGVTEARIARMGDGSWVAIFGNGYNSKDHKAVLFIVNLETGNLVKLIDTGEGSTSQPNGLAPAAWTHWPESELKAQWIYAGDLLGNLWRFDVTHNNSNNWKAEKIFAAGPSQPITSGLLLTAVPDHDGLMINFGTGSYFRVEDGLDIPSTPHQSLYGILDRPQDNKTTSVVTRSNDLIEQKIEFQGEATFTREDDRQVTHTIRILSDEPVDLTQKRGWYIDLNQVAGERVINKPTRRGTRVRFSTLIPNPDANPCSPSADGFFMDFNLRTGGREEDPVFDFTGDLAFDDADKFLKDSNDPGSLVAPSGVGGLTKGETISATRITDDGGVELPIPGDGAPPDDLLLKGDPLFSSGRQSWQQLR